MFNLVDTIKEVVKNRQTYLTKNKCIKLRFEDYSQSETAAVYGDKGRIMEVIDNLIDNAIKFSIPKDNNSENIIIRLDLDNKNRNKVAIVSVKDFGSGIDAEIISRLFTKFATKSDKGTGLGLFISKNIIEAHSGKIWAANNNNKYERGATFGFSLPLDNRTHIITVL
jgi:signal transduction histidine kinase